MKYPIALEQSKETASSWKVIIPDLQGCFAASNESIEDAIVQATRAATLWIEHAMDNDQEIPKPSPMEVVRQKYPHFVLSLVDIPEELSDKRTERVHISLPRRILTRLDNNAKALGDSRSSYIARLVLKE